ncbi:MAG: cytochrome C [Thermodesulfobacteria bacterium]|nr:cytochrome C [Thermodesulfobacteriota bacterium]
MYNAGKVIAGIIVFIVFFTTPIWLNFGKVEAIPKIPVPKKGQCVEPAAIMRAYHMKILDHWRKMAIRHNKYIYINSEGRKIRISLQKTCLKCHANKEQFCDKCHEFVVAHPDCWHCHFSKKEAQRWQ